MSRLPGTEGTLSQQLLDAAPDAMLVVDEAGRVVHVNARAEELFGYTERDLVGLEVELLVPEGLRQAHREQRSAYVEEPHRRPMGAGLQLEAVDRQGDRFPVEISLSPLELDGKLFVIAAVRDMRPWREARLARHQVETLYRTLAENIPNGSVLVLGRDYRYKLAAGAALSRAGIQEERLLGKTPAEVLPPQLAERRMDHYRAVLTRGAEHRYELHYEGRIYLQHTVPLFDEAGEVEGALALTQDITEMKEAEALNDRLLRLSERLHATLDPEELLETLTREAVALTGASGGFSGLRSAEGLSAWGYVWADDHPRHGEVLRLQKNWGPGEWIPGWVLQHKESYLSNDAATDHGEGPPADPELRRRFDIRSVLITPILNREGELLGFFEVNNKQGGEGFDEEDREMLVAVSQIAAIALENARSYADLQRMSRRVVQAQEEERRRLSRDLHDSVGQTLTALKMQLELLAPHLADSEQEAALREAIELAAESHEAVREASHALRPPMLDVAGLDKALSALCQEFSRQTGLRIDYEGSELAPLPDQVAISFYRFLQEALTNAARHAQAQQLEVSLQELDGEVLLRVQDDGVGLPEGRQPYSAGVGLLGQRERFRLIGGSVGIRSQAGQGTEVVARYRREAEEAGGDH